MRVRQGYPPLVNDPELAQRAHDSVRNWLGDSALIVPEQPDLTAEDFAFFARERPAVMAWLGCRPEGVRLEDTAMLHNTKFCPDEDCFNFGIEYLTGCALDFLRE